MAEGENVGGGIRAGGGRRKEGRKRLALTYFQRKMNSASTTTARCPGSCLPLRAELHATETIINDKLDDSTSFLPFSKKSETKVTELQGKDNERQDRAPGRDGLAVCRARGPDEGSPGPDEDRQRGGSSCSPDFLLRSFSIIGIRVVHYYYFEKSTATLSADDDEVAFLRRLRATVNVASTEASSGT